jgi:hypothetical protein
VTTAPTPRAIRSTTVNGLCASQKRNETVTEVVFWIAKMSARILIINANSNIQGMVVSLRIDG